MMYKHDLLCMRQGDLRLHKQVGELVNREGPEGLDVVDLLEDPASVGVRMD